MIDPNTSTPQRLPDDLTADLVPPPRRTYTDKLNDIVLAFRVEAWHQRQAFQDEFYELAKEAHHGLRARLFARSRV
jgi:hypothetical protein